VSLQQVKFAGKDAHLAKVVEIVSANGFIPEPLVSSEVDWFYTSLGIDDGYFAVESPETCADHIEVRRLRSALAPRFGSICSLSALHSRFTVPRCKPMLLTRTTSRSSLRRRPR